MSEVTLRENWLRCCLPSCCENWNFESLLVFVAPGFGNIYRSTTEKGKKFLPHSLSYNVLINVFILRSRLLLKFDEEISSSMTVQSYPILNHYLKVQPVQSRVNISSVQQTLQAPNKAPQFIVFVEDYSMPFRCLATKQKLTETISCILFPVLSEVFSPPFPNPSIFYDVVSTDGHLITSLKRYDHLTKDLTRKCLKLHTPLCTGSIAKFRKRTPNSKNIPQIARIFRSFLTPPTH